VFVTMFTTTCSNPFLDKWQDSVPSAPTGLTTTVTSTSVTISWNPVSGADRYDVYRSSTSYGTYERLGSTPNPSWTDTSLLTGTTYYYKVAAYNSAGTGSQSSAVSAETNTSESTLSAPTDVIKTDTTANSITISWASVSDATGYYVYRSSTLSGPYTKVGDTELAPYTDTGLPGGTTYYKVAAYDNAGAGPKSSDDVSITIVPSAPTGVMTTGATSTAIAISWSSVSGATGYYVYRSLTYSGPYTQVGDTTSTSFTNTGLSIGTTYYYKVAAYNSAGTGLQSSYILAATQASSSFSITITGTARAGQTLTATTSGTGWTGSFMWGYADSADANYYYFFSSGTSGTNSNYFTIPSGYTGKYIRAFRAHPSGTWTTTDGIKNFPSNFLGPVQP